MHSLNWIRANCLEDILQGLLHISQKFPHWLKVLETVYVVYVSILSACKAASS